jgi:hypothetical protein
VLTALDELGQAMGSILCPANVPGTGITNENATANVPYRGVRFFATAFIIEGPHVSNTSAL